MRKGYRHGVAAGLALAEGWDEFPTHFITDLVVSGALRAIKLVENRRLDPALLGAHCGVAVRQLCASRRFVVIKRSTLLQVRHLEYNMRLHVLPEYTRSPT